MTYNTLIISGFPKCRTTYYYQKIVENPNFNSSANKELKFNFSTNNHHEYDLLLKNYCTSKFKIDASPEYCYQEEFFEYLKTRPKVLNIILVRDPIDRLESILNFKKYTIGDLHFRDIDKVASYYLQGRSSDYSLVFERTKYEKFVNTIGNNTFIFNCNDEDKIFNFINKVFMEQFDYSNINVINKNPTKKISPLFQFLIRNFKNQIPRKIKDNFSFLKRDIIKEKFSPSIRDELKESYHKTYKWMNSLKINDEKII